MEQLFQMLSSIYPMSEGLMHYLKLTLQVVELMPGDYLLKKRQVSKHIYFVAEGMLRCYYLDEEEKQTTIGSGMRGTVTSGDWTRRMRIPGRSAN